ncbi:DUF5462 family protein [Photobacterium sp. S4TG1]|uniref:DUF5462 family protein n=1 Tax=Photobacterium sp. S4TG1 TaxID=3114587 RepID=UPI002E188530|nr:DUF5462 family protein [Photobacterium sp. S4TG1]
MQVMITRFIKTTFVLLTAISVLLITSHVVNAHPLSLNRSPILLGTVNGKVINNQYIEITKSLSNATLLTVRQQDIKTILQYLEIENATLNENNDGNVTITITKPLGTGVMTIRAVLGLRLNGQHVNMVGEQKGTTVRFIIPTAFKQLAVNVERPLRIQLPMSYRGPLNATLDITGWC